MAPPLRAAAVGALLAVLASAVLVSPGAAAPGATMPEPAPSLVVTTVLSGLSNAWDTAVTPDGALLVTERFGRVQVRRPDGTSGVVAADLGDLWAQGETGLMGIEVDPDFAGNRRIYTCQGTTDVAGGAVDGTSIQVVAWTVDAAYTSMQRVADPLVGGIGGTSGTHGGCQLRIDPQGQLRIGTGDAVVGTSPQDLQSLNGKTLRVDRFSGAGSPGNPFAGGGATAARIFTYGHRNVQGLAVHPVTGEVWSAEHGPNVDDEVNRLVAGGNYGWNPVPGYNQDVPMTDLAEFPSAVPARWSSGAPTVATSGTTFLEGSHWGPWQGALAVANLKASRLQVMRFDAGGQLLGVSVPPELNGTQGRLRSVEMGPCGVLYVTTDARADGDRVLAVRPTVDLGGAATAGIGDGRQVAARCGPAAGDVQLRGRTSGGTWQPWISLGGEATSDPDVASWGGGRVDVVVRGIDGATWHRGGQGGGFFPWESLGGSFTSAPAAVSWAPGRIDVVGRGLDGALWTTHWAGSGWSGWTSLGGVLTSAPDLASWGPNRYDVVARGLDGALWHRAWTGSGFTPWASLGGQLTSDVAAVSWGTGRIDVFGRGLDGALWTRYWDGGAWSAWYSLGGALRSAPDAGTRAPGTYEVLVEGVDGLLYQRSWTGTSFTGWIPLPA